MPEETKRRAEDPATEGGRTDYPEETGSDEEQDEQVDQTPRPRIGDPKYQAGGNPTHERGRQEGDHIEGLDED